MTLTLSSYFDLLHSANYQNRGPIRRHIIGRVVDEFMRPVNRAAGTRPGLGLLLCFLFAVAPLIACERGSPPPPPPPPPAPAPAPEAKAKAKAPIRAAAPVKRQLVNSRSKQLTFDQLQALGYVDGTIDPKSELTGVLTNVSARTNQGYNFYSSRKQPGAHLIDMEGHELHRWRSQQKGAWQHASLLPNGDVLVLVKDKRLSRYDKASKLVWSVKRRFHHDLWIHGDEIYVLAREARVVPYVHPKTRTLVDIVQVLSLDGEQIREFSVLDALHDSPYGFLLPSIAHEKARAKNIQLDVLHTNHVEVLDGRLSNLSPIYANGNFLISARNINAVAILDGKSLDVLWIWGPTNITFQHHPTMLDNGHILLFDNGSSRSRVIEIDPLTQQIVWQYAPKSGFFSATRGSNQRLSNGNTLITESDTGYVLEVAPDGDIVWKFANPIVNSKKQREAIWRMTRVDPETLTFLDEHSD